MTDSILDELAFKANLTKQSKLVARAVLVSGLQVGEVATMFDLSHQRVSAICNKIRRLAEDTNNPELFLRAKINAALQKIRRKHPSIYQHYRKVFVSGGLFQAGQDR